MTTYQLIDVTPQKNAVVVSIREEFLSTAIAAEILENDLLQVISTYHPTLLVLDFSHVKMISSSTIGRLLLIQKRLEHTGGQLHLCCVSIPIAEVYRTLGLIDKHLLVFDSVREALNTRVVGLDEEREIMED
jgi:anti-anti-sigma factor